MRTIYSYCKVFFLVLVFPLYAVDTLSPLNFCTPLDTSQAPKDISAVLESIIAKHNVPGIVAAIIYDGRLHAAGAAGVRARSFSERVTLNDLFHIGSDTKAMTATLAAILVEKGLLKWDSKVIDIFPDLADKINPAYRS
jgi:CubicO group peptidase (beta-lactamase class C family)